MIVEQVAMPADASVFVILFGVRVMWTITTMNDTLNR